MRSLGESALLGAHRISDTARPAASPYAIKFPVVASEWKKNAAENIRIAIDHYKGSNNIDLRTWWRNNEGMYLPGRSGLTVALTHLPRIVSAVETALDMAVELGLLERPTE